MLPKLCYVTIIVQHFPESAPQKYCERVYASTRTEIVETVQERQRHAHWFLIDKIEGLET